MGFPINPPHCALVDNNGMVSPEWYRFFVAIQRMIGGPSSPFDDNYFLGSFGSGVALNEHDGDFAAPVAHVQAEDALPSPPVIMVVAEDALIPPAMPIPASDDLMYPPRYGV